MGTNKESDMEELEERRVTQDPRRETWVVFIKPYSQRTMGGL